jgi:chemotaxis signal transduction protein
MDALPSSPKVAAGSDWLCTFALGDQLYGIDARVVLEVAGTGAVVEVPRAPRPVRGLCNRRGAPVALIDLEELLDIAGVVRPLPISMLVLKQGEVVLAFGIDRILSVSAFETANVAQRSLQDHPSVAFFLPKDGEMVTVLSAAHIFQRVDALRMGSTR